MWLLRTLSEAAASHPPTLTRSRWPKPSIQHVFRILSRPSLRRIGSGFQRRMTLTVPGHSRVNAFGRQTGYRLALTSSRSIMMRDWRSASPTVPSQCKQPGGDQFLAVTGRRSHGALSSSASSFSTSRDSSTGIAQIAMSVTSCGYRQAEGKRKHTWPWRLSSWRSGGWLPAGLDYLTMEQASEFFPATHFGC